MKFWKRLIPDPKYDVVLDHNRYHVVAKRFFFKRTLASFTTNQAAQDLLDGLKNERR